MSKIIEGKMSSHEIEMSHGSISKKNLKGESIGVRCVKLDVRYFVCEGMLRL